MYIPTLSKTPTTSESYILSAQDYTVVRAVCMDFTKLVFAYFGATGKWNLWVESYL